MTQPRFLLVLATLQLASAEVAAQQTLRERVWNGARAVGRELRRYGRDAQSIVMAPTHWRAEQWKKAGLVTAGLGAVMLADEEIQEIVQKNRTDETEDFADFVTPWGGQRARNLSLGLILIGAVLNNDNLRDTGRDALETTIFAGGVVTPLLKQAAGRSRPFLEEGTYAFDPFSGNTSFPSGHATNAFSVAAVVGEHYDGWVPVLAYTLASSVAFARVHDNVHFASDVVAGGIVGTAMGRAVVARNRSPRSDEASLLIIPDLENDSIAFLVSFSSHRMLRRITIDARP